jgi:hypothetical protein
MKSLRTRITAWWSAWQFVVYLSVVLAASLYGNVWQWKRAITAPLRDQVAELEQAQETAGQLIEDGQVRERGLLEAIDTATQNARKAGRDYRAAAAARPIDPQCAPGQARVDAVNRALGAQPE